MFTRPLLWEWCGSFWWSCCSWVASDGASGELSLSVAPPGGGNISVPVHLAGERCSTSGLRDYSWYTVAWLVVAHPCYIFDHGRSRNLITLNHVDQSWKIQHKGFERKAFLPTTPSYRKLKQAGKPENFSTCVFARSTTGDPGGWVVLCTLQKRT